MNDQVASSTNIGTPREEGTGSGEMMNLGIGVLRCSVIVRSQDTDFGWIGKSWSHCLPDGRESS